MTTQQLTLDNKSFNLLGRKKIHWAKPPKPDPNKLTFYRAIVGDKHPIYDLIEQVAPEITAMYPELNGFVFRIRVKPMSWCAACWNYENDEIDFSTATVNEWSAQNIGETLAHELTHAFHSKFKSIPSGEKATDVFMLSRIPLKHLRRPSYLEVAKEPFEMCPGRVQDLAKQAIVKRGSGLRQYIQWFEDEVNKIYYDMKGEPMPERKRFSWAACKKQREESLTVVTKNLPVANDIYKSALLVLMDLEKQSGGAVSTEVFLRKLREKNIFECDAQSIVRKFLREGTVYEPSEGYIRKT